MSVLLLMDRHLELDQQLPPNLALTLFKHVHIYTSILPTCGQAHIIHTHTVKCTYTYVYIYI